MTRLADFFKGSDTTLGIFYPNHHLVAVFRKLHAAQEAAGKLQLAGFSQDDVISAAGKEVIELASEETGLGGFVLQAMSRFFATEQKYTDHDLEHARHDAGFLIVNCPTEEIKNAAWGIIEHHAPLDARYYTSSGIEHLAGDFKTD